MWTYPDTDVLHHQKLSATHVRSAGKLLKLAENNGGVYIKVRVEFNRHWLLKVAFSGLILPLYW